LPLSPLDPHSCPRQPNEFAFASAAFEAKLRKAEFYQDPVNPTLKKAVVEFAFATMKRERDRIDAEIAHLSETRDALDGLLSANSRHRAKLSTAPVPRSA